MKVLYIFQQEDAADLSNQIRIQRGDSLRVGNACVGGIIGKVHEVWVELNQDHSVAVYILACGGESGFQSRECFLGQGNGLDNSDVVIRLSGTGRLHGQIADHSQYGQPDQQMPLMVKPEIFQFRQHIHTFSSY